MIESILSFFSSHSGIKLEINYKKKNEENKYLETKQHATKKTNGSMKKSKRKSENTSRQMKILRHHSKSMECSKISSEWEVCSDTGYRKKTSNTLT